MDDRRDEWERWLKIGSLLVTVAAFVVGVIQFNRTEKAKQRQEAQQQQQEQVARELAARRPYLDRQLLLYTEAANSAATLANSTDPKALEAARQRFWQLFWGELAMVEDLEVDVAMNEFGTALSEDWPQEALQMCSLRLSHMLRRSLANSWGTKVWDSPYVDPKNEPACQKPDSEPPNAPVGTEAN